MKKGIYDYINKIRFCNSSKNLTSVENISEEIDLDDINDDDLDDNNNENNNNKGHKQFTLTTFDELDEEDEGNNNNDSIGEIFKQTAEMIQSIKLRKKINEKKESFNKNVLNNIIIEDKKDLKNNNENSKKKSKTLNKFNSKSKSNICLGLENRNNSLPVIIGNNDDNFNSEKSKKSNINKNIFNYKNNNNDNNIKILPNIKIKIREQQNHERYFYDRDINKKNLITNNNERINNFRSNNIIKMKENKENSLFSSLKRSSDNSTNFKYCISFFNKNNKKDKKEIKDNINNK
mgnify:CR=1 FL=1